MAASSSTFARWYRENRQECVSETDVVVILSDMKLLDPTTLATTDPCLLAYGADLVYAALINAASVHVPSYDVEEAAALAARWRVVLYASGDHWLSTDEFIGLHDRVARWGLCKNLEEELHDPDKATLVVKQAYMHGYEVLRKMYQDAACRAAATVDALSLHCKFCPTAGLPCEEIWEHVCRKLFETYKGICCGDWTAHACMYFFEAAWVHLRREIPIPETPQREADGPWYMRLNDQFTAWRLPGREPTGADPLDGDPCKGDVDVVLDHIISKAHELGVHKLCDLSHKEGPWLAGPLHHKLSNKYILEYYSAGDKSEALRELDLLEFPSSAAAKCARTEAVEA